MCKFTAVITVMNQSKNHWVTLRFNPKEKTLEVFDSLQSGNFSNSEKKYEKVGPQIHGLNCYFTLYFMNRIS